MTKNKTSLTAKLPRAIIFDWDNTLVDTWPLIHLSINKTMRFMDRDEWSFEEVKQKIHKSMRESFPDLFGDDWEKAGEVYLKSYWENNLTNLQLLDGATNILEFFRQNNIAQFIVSNKLGKTLRQECDALEISHYFSKAIGSHDAKKDKPNPDPVWLALDGSNINPKKDLIWFIGDTIADIDCALNTNCQPILFGNGTGIDPALIEELKKREEKPLLQFLDHFHFLNKIISKE